MTRIPRVLLKQSSYKEEKPLGELRILAREELEKFNLDAYQGNRALILLPDNGRGHL
jgi:hypothetical protein